MSNVLYYGNNLPVMRQHIADETVDLVYLDPPFNSNAAYNVLFAEKNGTRSHAQAHAFEDTWHWGPESAECYEDVVERGGKAADAMIAFRKLLGTTQIIRRHRRCRKRPPVGGSMVASGVGFAGLAVGGGGRPRWRAL